jgi:hypothetical protein
MILLAECIRTDGGPVSRSIGETLETHMKRKENAGIPLHDYRAALQGAMSWLGDKYLLAEPAPRLTEERKPYFAEQRRWHPAIVAGAITKASR